MSLPNNTFASPGNPYYALKGEIVGAQDWYQFPSLTGEIQLVDASGTQLLQSIDGNLFYNNELLAKANDIQDIADWSLYPSIATVQLAGQNITQVNQIDASRVVVTDISAGTIDVTGDITSAFPGSLYTTGINIRGDNATPAPQQLLAGTISTTGTASLNSMQLTAPNGFGADLNNNQLKRVSTVNISNAGAAPYGALTSPDGVMLTWNGQTITTGAGGNVSQWANYPAVAPINANTNNITNAGSVACTSLAVSGDAVVQTSVITPAVISPVGDNLLVGANADLNINSLVGTMLITSGNNLTMATTGGDASLTAYNNVSVNSGNDILLTADAGINPLVTPTVNLTAQNGNGGRLDLMAKAGTGIGPAQIGYGQISLQALGADNGVFNLGGLIDLTAYSGSIGEYGGATSRVSASAATIALSAGAAPVLPGLAGSMNIFGQGAVSIVASLLPPVLPQFPETIYMYGLGIPAVAGGVRLESPNGIQMLSDTYIENLYPLDGNGLTIQGRSLPDGYVTIKDVAGLTMTAAGPIKTNFINSVSSNGVFYEDNLYPNNNNLGVYANFLKPTQATGAGVPNLLIANNPFFGNTNYVEISGADVIAFDPTGTGALKGVQSINGAVWPPPTGDASLWSQYPQTSTLDSSGFGIINLSTINGIPYPPTAPADWWTLPAEGNVDISGFDLNNVNNLTMPANGVIVSAGALNIFSDLSGDLTLAANGGGNVNIGTGNAGDINISTSGSGNNLNLAGDTVSITAGATILANSPFVVNPDNDSLINIGVVNNKLQIGDYGVGVGPTNQPALILKNTAATTTLGLDESGKFILNNDTFGIDVSCIGNYDELCGGVKTTNALGGVLISSGTDISLQAPVTVGSVGMPQDVTVNGLVRATGDVESSLGVNNYSLNTIGALVGNIPSGFRDQTEFYVSADGSDNGLGSILSPYRTIQKAITQAELISSAALVCVINVASGHYTENLTFNRGYICLNGSLQSQTGNEVCEITGSISIAVAGASDLFNRQISFQGFNLTCNVGQAITDTSTTPHIVSFQDCKCFVFNQFFVSTTAAADMRLYITNVEVQQTNAGNTLPVIATNVGQIEFERLDVNLSGNCSAIVIGGTSILSRFSLSTLDANSTAATLAPLLLITSNTVSAHSTGNVAFAFGSAVSKSNTSAVYISSGVSTNILMFNNVFSLQGTSLSTNFTVGYDGSANPTILGVNNTSLNVPTVLPQTTAVQTGIAQVAYTDINPPVMGAYSKSGDQTIAAVNTPVAITFNTTQFQQGTALATTRLQVSTFGNYQVTYQVQTQAAVAAIVTTYLSKNGTALPNTGSQFTSGTGSQVQTSPQFIITLNALDYIELFINSNALGTIVNSTAAAGALPAIPGALITITQIR